MTEFLGPVPDSPPVERGRTFLVVDDDDRVRTFVRRFLESEGHRVVSAVGGAEALECFRGAPQDFDAVLLDLTMPGMSGVTVFAELRRLDPGVPVVLTSGYEADRVESLLDRPGVQFLAKPYLPDDLREQLARARRIGRALSPIPK